MILPLRTLPQFDGSKADIDIGRKLEEFQDLAHIVKIDLRSIDAGTCPSISSDLVERHTVGTSFYATSPHNIPKGVEAENMDDRKTLRNHTTDVERSHTLNENNGDAI